MIAALALAVVLPAGHGLDVYAVAVFDARGCPPPVELWAFPAVRAAVLRVAVAREVADEREAYLLSSHATWAEDVASLRRWADLVRDCPPAGEAYRLPPLRVLADGCAFNRAFRRHTEGRVELEPDRADELMEVVRECDRLFAVWDAARDAQTPWYLVAIRRQRLATVRDLVGEAAWLAGDIGPPAPLWRFEELR